MPTRFVGVGKIAFGIARIAASRQAILPTLHINVSGARPRAGCAVGCLPRWAALVTVAALRHS